MSLYFHLYINKNEFERCGCCCWNCSIHEQPLSLETLASYAVLASIHQPTYFNITSIDRHNTLVCIENRSITRDLISIKALELPDLLVELLKQHRNELSIYFNHWDVKNLQFDYLPIFRTIAKTLDEGDTETIKYTICIINETINICRQSIPCGGFIVCPANLITKNDNKISLFLKHKTL